MNTGNDEEFGKIIRTAGRGPNLTPEARERIRVNVEATWRESLQTHGRSLDTPSSMTHMARGRRRRRSQWLAPALAAALAIVVSAVLFIEPENASQPGGIEFAQVSATLGSASVERNDRVNSVEDVINVGDRVVTSDAGSVALRLSTGEELRLNSDTIVEFSAGDSIRLIFGMVYFDAPPGSSGADFFVHTDFGIVEHVGTQYSASLDDDALVVSVREGEALIRDADRELSAATGEQIRVEITGTVNRSEFAADHPDWAWVESLARANFDGPSSVMSLLEWAARESGRQIRVDSEAARLQAESVTVNQVDGLTPAEILTVIRSTTDFELSESDTSVAVSLR